MNLSVIVKRVFNAPRQLVWNAWTEPDLIAQWWAPEGLHTPLESITCDVRPGGAFAMKMVKIDDGTEYAVDAEFEAVDPPVRMVLVNANPEEDSKITVTFVEFGGDKTEVTLVQTGTMSDDQRASMDAGWTSQFGKLAKFIAQ